MQILFIFLNCLKHVLLFYFFKQCFTVDLFEAGFKVYILHLFYMCVKPFKVCNSSFFMFSLAIYLLKGMSLRLLIFQIWLFVSSWFYLTCSSISRIPCKVIVRLEAWLKSGSNSLEEYFYKSAIKFVIKHRFTD